MLAQRPELPILHAKQDPIDLYKSFAARLIRLLADEKLHAHKFQYYISNSEVKLINSSHRLVSEGLNANYVF